MILISQGKDFETIEMIICTTYILAQDMIYNNLRATDRDEETSYKFLGDGPKGDCTC